MFTIIGGDGKEYGPATADQVRTWLASGRANLDTKARAVGSEEWRRLGDFPEFGAPGAALPPIAPPFAGTPSAAATTTFAAPLSTTPAVEPGTRLLARLIDWVLSMLSMSPGIAVMGGEFMRLAMGAMRGEQIDFEQLDTAKLAGGAAILIGGWLLLLIVQVVLLTTRGQSIGKIVLRLKVVRLDGSAAGIVHAWLLREALMTVIGVFLGLLPMIGILFRPAFHITDWCFVFRADRRCLHDLIAGTKVIKA